MHSRTDHGDQRVGATRALDGVLGAGELGRTRDEGARRLRHVLQQRVVLVGGRRAPADRASVSAGVGDHHLVVATSLRLTLLNNGGRLLLRLLRLSRRGGAVLVPGRLLRLSWLLRRSLLRLLGLLLRLRLSLELCGGLLGLLLLMGLAPLLRRSLVATLLLPLLRSRLVPTVAGATWLLSPSLLLLLLRRRLLVLLLLRLLIGRLLGLLGLLPLLRRTLLLGWTLLLRWAVLLPLLGWRLLLGRTLLRRRSLLPLLRRGLLLLRGSLLPLLRGRLLLLRGHLLLLRRLTPRRTALAPVPGMWCLLLNLGRALGRALRWRLVAVRGTTVLTPGSASLGLRRRGLLLLGLHGSHGTLARRARSVARLGRRSAVLRRRVERLLQTSECTGTGGQSCVVGVEGAGVGGVLGGKLRLGLLLRRRRSLPKVLLGGSRLWLLRSALTSLALSAGFLDLVGPLVEGPRKKAVGIEQVVVAELEEGILVGLVRARRTSSVDFGLGRLGPASDILDITLVLHVSLRPWLRKLTFPATR